MKIILSLLQLFIIAASLHAAPIDKKEAIKIGNRFMFGKDRKIGYGVQVEKFERVYVINYNVSKERMGYVVVADNNELPSVVLAFAKEGNLNTKNGTMQSILRSYSRDIALWEEGKAETTEEDTVYYQRKDTICQPLLPRVYWGQNFPYNLLMPKDANDKNSLTGCASVAIAEIMNYHRHPAQGTGVSLYSHNVENGKKFSFIVEYDSLRPKWNAMAPQYTIEDISAAANSVCPLLYYCAMAAETNFGNDGSSGFTMPTYIALSKHFGYHPEIYYVRKMELTDSQFVQFLYKELEQKRPLLCCGHQHIFTCDGFLNDFFHIDWGWKGAMNGYFKLSALPAGKNNFLLFPNVIGKIRPLNSPKIHKAIRLSAPGTLHQKLTDEEVQKLTSLKVSGPLNGRDIALLRHMAGGITSIFEDGGELRELDLSETAIVDNYEYPYYRRDLRKEWWSNNTRSIRIDGKLLSFDFKNMTDEEWKEYCRLGGNIDPNKEWKYVKEGDDYFLQYYTKSNVIGQFMFKDCRNLTSLILPPETEQIKEFAFQSCVSLQQFILPSFVRDIQPRAWESCHSLKAIFVAKANEYFTSKDGILYDKNLTTLICYPTDYQAVEFYVPQEIQTIYPYAFSESSLLLNVTLPKQLKRMRSNSFFNCRMLRSVTIPEGVEDIGNNAFSGCKELSQANLPARFQQEYNRIFTNCPLMKKE